MAAGVGRVLVLFFLVGFAIALWNMSTDLLLIRHVLHEIIVSLAEREADRAQAAKVRARDIELPPLKYDRPYTGNLIVKHLSLRSLDRDCGGPAWACQEDTAENTCTIWMPRDNLVSAEVYHRLWRHEIGHCNGWPGHHPGARR